MQTKILLKSKLFIISEKVRLDYQQLFGKRARVPPPKSLVVEIDVCRTRECGENTKRFFPLGNMML